MQCKAFKLRCAQCEHGFYRQRDRYVEKCPVCGTPRVRCSKEAVPGYDWFGEHGGPNPRFGFYGYGKGMIDGSKSKFQLTRLASKYVEMQDNGRMLSNRVSLQVVRQRIDQLAERINFNDAPDRLATLQGLWVKLRDAENSPSPLERAEVSAIKQMIDDQFEMANTDYLAWKQMFDALDLDRKLVESEVKIAKDIQAILTAEDAYELAAKLLAAIISTVSSMLDISPKVKGAFLKRIQFEFTRVVGDGLAMQAQQEADEVIDGDET